MSGGFEVVMADVRAASQVFGQESAVVGAAVAGGGPRPVDGGGAVVDAALSHALHAAVLTTRQLAAVIEAHSRKLDTAYGRYHASEEGLTRLCQQLAGLA